MTKIFQKLSEYNLKVQLNKYQFLSKGTVLFCHIITTERIKPNPSKEYKRNETIFQTDKILRKFLKNFSPIAHPFIKYLKKNAKIF